MESLNGIPDKSATWLQPPAEEEGLRRYLTTLRQRLPLIVVTTVVTTLIAIAYVATTAKQYTAESNLLITPIAVEDPALNSLGLLTASSDPTRDVETAAKLVTNHEVAKLAAAKLKTGEDAEEVLENVSAVPVAQSSVISVSGTTSTPAGARELADIFARAAVENRTDQMHQQIDQILPGLERQLAATPNPETGQGTLSAQVAELQTLRSANDPTIRVAVSAALPTSPSRPKTALSVIAGILAGLVLGIGIAFTAQNLDPRLRREEQLRRGYRIPIMARVPKEDGRRGRLPLGPRNLSPAATEAYRTLRATLATGHRPSEEGRVVLVTGTTPTEGKTTTALNLAAAFALSGKRVILIESDLRRPAVGKALGLRPDQGGILGLLAGDLTLSDALISYDALGSSLRILLADYDEGWIPELFSIPAAGYMIEEARRMADYVIIDSAPLAEVADALPLAEVADDVLVVTRLGRTRLDRLSRLGEFLVENDIRPTGFVLVGTQRPHESSYYSRLSKPDGRSLASGRAMSRSRS